MTAMAVRLCVAAQLCRWTVMNVVVIYFIPRPLAGCEHSLIPVRASFSRPLIAPSSGHLIRSMKWGLWLLRRRFDVSRKIRSILINYPSYWIVHIYLRWRRGCFASGRTTSFNTSIRRWCTSGRGGGGGGWFGLGGVPSTKIRDGGTSQLLSGFGVLVNRSN